MRLTTLPANRLIAILASVVIAGSAAAQSTLHCLKEEQWLPVYEVRTGKPYYFTGDGLEKGNCKTVTMLSSSKFGKGYYNVEILSNRRIGIEKKDDGFLFVSKEGKFEFTASITATQDMENAYCVFRYNRLDQTVFSCHQIGDLKAGKARMISITRDVTYEMPVQLHFYSGTEEIRSNLVPNSYTYKHGEFLLATAY